MLKLLKPGLEKDDNNIIWVTDFSEPRAQSFCQQVIQISDKDMRVPIVAYIDSYGGYVDALAAMISVLDSVPNPFVAVAVGKAMSAGAMLLSYGDFRYVGPHARVMVHEISACSIGHIGDLKVSNKENERINDHWMAWLAANCGIRGGYAGLKAKMKGLLPADGRDLYLTPEEAIRFGIADGIGIPKLISQPQYELVTLPEMLKRTEAATKAKKGSKRTKAKKGSPAK